MTTVFFNILFGIYVILYLPILLLRGKWHDGFRERFGFFSPELKKRLGAGKNIWLHAVSVGEVIAVEGIARQLRSVYPERHIILSVTTKTGYSLARRKYGEDLIVIWSPLDFSWSVRSFLKAIDPVVYIAAETELWPNLFEALEKKGVPIVIVNGRISDTAFPRYRLVKGLLRDTLRRVKLFCMQSEADAERVIALGADPAVVRMVGNVKFDNVPEVLGMNFAAAGLSPEHFVLVGGSTHPGEEEILIDIYLALKAKWSALRLVLAPRHPERSAKIAECIRINGLKPVLYSKNQATLKQDEVLIIDTIGNLLSFYALATIVFVGKSLTVKGGHNIIEPAAFGKPIIIGPNMQNFKDITQAFLIENAALQVEDALQLKHAIAELLSRPEIRRDIGDRARVVIRQNHGATQKTMDLLGRIVV